MEQTCDSRGLASYLGALSAPSVTSRWADFMDCQHTLSKKLSNHKEWTFDLVTVKSLPLNLNKVIRMSKWWKYTLTHCCQAFSAFAWPVLLFISCVFLVEALLCVVECQLHVVWLNSALACVLSICSLTWHYIAGSMKCFFSFLIPSPFICLRGMVSINGHRSVSSCSQKTAFHCVCLSTFVILFSNQGLGWRTWLV